MQNKCISYFSFNQKLLIKLKKKFLFYISVSSILEMYKLSLTIKRVLLKIYPFYSLIILVMVLDYLVKTLIKWFIQIYI